MDINKLKFIDELEKLKLPQKDYIIYGSAPLVLRELKKENTDLDILVDSYLWEKLKQNYPITIVKKRNEDIEFIRIGNIEIANKAIIYGYNIKQLIDRSDVIEGYNIMSLEDTILWKTFLNRERDSKEIEMIQEYIVKTNKQS